MGRSRARAIALARRREPTPWLPWLLVALLSLACITAAEAQTTPGGAAGTGTAVPEQVAPPIAAPTAPSHGSVITPPAHVDPGMHVKAPPASRFPTPVLKPKGSATRSG